MALAGARGRKALGESLMACMKAVSDPQAREALRDLYAQLSGAGRLGRSEAKRLAALIDAFPAVAQRGIADVTGYHLKQIGSQIAAAEKAGRRGWRMGMFDRLRGKWGHNAQDKVDSHDRLSLEAKSKQVDRQLHLLEQRMVSLDDEREAINMQLSVVKHDAAKLDPEGEAYKSLRMKALLLLDQMKNLDRQIGQYRDMLCKNHRYQQMVRQGLSNIDLKRYALDIPELEVTVKDIVDADALMRDQVDDMGDILRQGERAIGERAVADFQWTRQEELFDGEIRQMAGAHEADAAKDGDKDQTIEEEPV